MYVKSRAIFAQSKQRRFSRWLHNPRINVQRLYSPLIQMALVGWEAKELYLSIDTSMLWNRYYPPYASKYNPIEHRLFPHLTRACSGVIFDSWKTVKSLMEKATTRTGLRVFATVIEGVYETGKKSGCRI
ncbi:MAG: hypothetical protein QNJ38_19980 [Prochloraceae cyanobacterium]|nr:hypothetical protein [Prochloraceae cyanobacterium]